MINVLIVEDEKPAQEYLIRLLTQLHFDINILAIKSDIKSTVIWLKSHVADLIFMDIQLADGVSFKIFDEIEVRTPVIFTTAFDQYAIKAFKFNSIDYLLKPIDPDDLKKSLEKFSNNRSQISPLMLRELLKQVHPLQNPYQERFVVFVGEKVLSIIINQIAYFEAEDRYVYLVKKDGSRYIVNYNLSDLIQKLDPKIFFRLNRSFIAGFDAIRSMHHLSKSRIKVELIPAAKREVIVSNIQASGFKHWLNQ